jgi:hypothetical protein
MLRFIAVTLLYKTLTHHHSKSTSDVFGLMPPYYVDNFVQQSKGVIS